MKSVPAAKPSARPRGRRPGTAAYKQIAEQIERDIASGKFPVGSLLPTEAEFGAELDVGRHTVRDALRVLKEVGLIVRRAGSGSTVVSKGRRRVFVHSVVNFDQWFTYPDSIKRRQIDHAHVQADAELAQGLGCPPGTAWFRISALRVVGEPVPPLCWVDIYVQPRFAAVVKSRRVDAVPIHEQIEQMFGVAITDVEVTISVARVPARMAKALAVKAQSPALLLRRRYLAANGELLQATLTVHPESRYVYDMKFHKEAQSH